MTEGDWRFRRPRPSEPMEWHYVRDGEKQTACRSYSANVLEGKVHLPLDELERLIRSANATICTRCAERSKG